MTLTGHLRFEYKKEIGLTILIIISLGASVNFLIFGFADLVSFSDYRNYLLLPSLFIVLFISIYWYKKNKKLVKTLATGLLIGLIATVALEAIRIPSVYVQWIPHDDMIAMPGKLLLVSSVKGSDLMMNPHQETKMTDTKTTHQQTKENENPYKSEHDNVGDKTSTNNSAQPTTPELVAGGLYHFWNGATMAAVYTLVIGKRRWYFGLIWGFIIHIGMMLAPWMLATGGPFGANYGMGYTIFTASLFAHLAYGAILGILAQRFIQEKSSLLELIRHR